ncbi:hypothetical protein GGF46_005350 [Coemansia sp. RSA 552]|nr:hypothetical protein GGF46_005350 [Coemansia sp. RSA 552]
MASEEGAETIVTACGYLTAQAALEREAAEVLTGKFDECTFDKGYVSQPLYACLTCTRPPAQHRQPAADGRDEEPTEPAGMCYSCSIECHPGHDVIELFTKRRFRCDCGTRRLLPGAGGGGNGNGCCQLKKTRSALADSGNSRNAYNHNFWGFYCRCDRFYDPAHESGLMIQCYICNDWFHDACIGAVPDEARYSDYICRGCVAAHAVVRCIDSTRALRGVVRDGRVARLEPAGPGRQADAREPGPGDDGEPVRKKARGAMCRLRSDGGPEQQELDLFMAQGWREDVCTCVDCMREIEGHGLTFLVDDEEVVEPEEDEARSESLYASALRQLRTMDHTRAVDAATAYRSLSTSLKDYLRPFAASGRVVTGQDIHAFFEQRRGSA